MLVKFPYVANRDHVNNATFISYLFDIYPSRSQVSLRFNSIPYNNILNFITSDTAFDSKQYYVTGHVIVDDKKIYVAFGDSGKSEPLDGTGNETGNLSKVTFKESPWAFTTRLKQSLAPYYDSSTQVVLMATVDINVNNIKDVSDFTFNLTRRGNNKFQGHFYCDGKLVCQQLAMSKDKTQLN